MRHFLLLAISYLYLSANAHIFVYHRFGDDKHPSTNTSISQLREQFEFLKVNNYKVVKIEDIIKKVQKKEDIPDNWVALTIDDAYKSFYENGLSVFKEYNYPFSIYVYVKASQKNYGHFLSWEKLREIKKFGSVELHSYSHEHMTSLTPKQMFQDTKKAYEIFTSKMGYEPSIYVYPYGEYNYSLTNQIKKFGFKAILNQSSGSVNKESDVFDINRIALVGDVNLKEKLKYKTFDVQWTEPTKYPKDSVLKKVKASVDKKIKNVKLYVTGHGWRDIKVNDGIIDVNLNLKLKKNRTRVIIGKDYYHISNKIIIKNKENTNVK